MSVLLSDFKKSIRKLLEAEDTEEAFSSEGYDASTAEKVSQSKGFRSARRVVVRK